LSLSKSKGLDLIEISPNANPPVCKLMSFSKYKYEQSKKDRENKQKNKTKDIKEIRFKPFIGIGDYNNKINRIREFLEDKHRVKIVIRMTGRASNENATLLMKRIIVDLENDMKLESEPKLEGRTIISLLQPIK
jgi:translation initiation factor IF-3